MDLLAQSRLGTDAIKIADQEHPDHQLGIDGRSPDPAVERLELGAQAFEIEMPVDPAQQVVAGHMIPDPEPVE